MPKVSTFLVDRFETVEALAVVDVLRRAGVIVDMISITEEKEVVSAQQVTVHADYLYNEYDFKDSDVLFLPGGPGTKNYEKFEPLMELVKKFYADGKRVAAICAAPSVLGHLGLLEGKKATCFPGYEKDLYGAQYVDTKCVTDGLISTGKGMGASIDLGLELVKVLVNEETSINIGKAIQYL